MVTFPDRAGAPATLTFGGFPPAGAALWWLTPSCRLRTRRDAGPGAAGGRAPAPRNRRCRPAEGLASAPARFRLQARGPNKRTVSLLDRTLDPEHRPPNVAGWTSTTYRSTRCAVSSARGFSSSSRRLACRARSSSRCRFGPTRSSLRHVRRPHRGTCCWCRSTRCAPDGSAPMAVARDQPGARPFRQPGHAVRDCHRAGPLDTAVACNDAHRPLSLCAWPRPLSAREPSAAEDRPARRAPPPSGLGDGRLHRGRLRRPGRLQPRFRLLLAERLRQRHDRVRTTFGWATEWLRRSPARPFFAFVHTYQPHSPYWSPEPIQRRFAQPPGLASPLEPADAPQIERGLAKYDAAIRYTDDALAELLAALEAAGLASHTLVVVTSDHGEAFGEHGPPTTATTLYEEVLHVPLLFRAPGLVAADAASAGLRASPTSCPPCSTCSAWRRRMRCRV